MKLALGIAAAALAALAGSASAQFTVTDGDASLNVVGPVPFSSNLPNATWRLDGPSSPDQLSQFNWYYRTENNNINRVFSSLDTPASSVAGDTMTFTYTNAGPGPVGTERFNAVIKVQIEDAAAANTGRVYSELVATASAANTGPRVFNFFVIIDPDLAGGSPNPGTNDSVSYSGNSATFTETGSNDSIQTIADSPTKFEVNTASSIRSKLNGGSFSLGNLADPVAGDVAAAYQWTVTLAPGESRTFRAGFAINQAAQLQPATCPSDFNSDGFVDDTDFVLFAQAYDLFTVPPAAAAADLNSDGFVDDTDFVLFAQAYDLFTCP